MITRLEFARSVRWQEYQTNGFLSFYRRMRGTVVSGEGNTPTWQKEMSTKLADPLFKNGRGHPCLLVCKIFQWQLFDIFETYLGFNERPIVISGSFSVLLMLAPTRNIIRSFGSFPPVHSSPLKARVLSGRRLKKRHASFALNTSSDPCSFRISGRVSFSHSSICAESTGADSPQIALKTIPVRFFYLFSQPVEGRKFSNSISLATSFAFSIKTGPGRGTLIALACLNHRYRTSSTSSTFPVCIRFRSS